MEQVDGVGEEIFWGETDKILILMELFDCREGLAWQNLEPQRLIRKILRNKELRCTVCQEPPPHGCGHDRTSRLWTARSDVTKGEEKLWKSSVHSSVKATPAVGAGLTNRVWSVAELMS